MCVVHPPPAPAPGVRRGEPYRRAGGLGATAEGTAAERHPRLAGRPARQSSVRTDRRFAVVPSEQIGQDPRVLDAHGVQRFWVQAQGADDRRRHLLRADFGRHHVGFE